MKPIIAPVDRKLLKSELTDSVFLRNTRKGNNMIFDVNIHNAPNVLREIGRLREITFRDSGGGTGEEIDLDEHDISARCYQQLIVWSPEDEEIVGGYRYIKCDEAKDEKGNYHLSTSHYFDFSSTFLKDFLPKTIELGRSWIQPSFQPKENPQKGLYALDNIWDGLGALVKFNPEIRYFFGKVTMYPDFHRECRDFILSFMHFYFPDREKLITPHNALDIGAVKDTYQKKLEGLDFKEGLKILNAFVRENVEFIPPLVNIYMGLSPTMKTFGTAINAEFGNVEETGILVTIDDIYLEKKERYLVF